MYLLKQLNSTRPLLFLMVDSTDHLSPKTGLAPTVTISKNGAAFGAPNGAVTEVGNGWYKVAPTTSDASALGPLLLHATAAGADPCDVAYDIVAYDPENATRLGLSCLPTSTFNQQGGLVGIALRSATAQAGSTSNTLKMDAGAGVVNNFYNGLLLTLISGTGSGQSRTVTAYDGSTKVATVDRPWVTVPDGTSAFILTNANQPTLDANLGVTAGTVTDKTGYALTQVFPANFSALAITGGGVTLADGVAHGGPLNTSTATLNLKQLSLVNLSDIAFKLYSSTASGGAVDITNSGGSGVVVNAYGNIGSVGIDLIGAAADLKLSGTGAITGNLTGRVLGATATAFVGNGVQAQLAQAFPANFAALAITAGGAVTAGTVADKTGYSLAGPVTVSGNVTVGGYVAGQDPATLVLDVAAVAHDGAGTIGAAINDAAAGGGGGGGGGDPLTNLVPGSYASGTAGAALGRIAGADINVTSPISTSGDVRLIRGDAYLAADGRGLVYTDASHVWPDNATAVWNLYATSAGDDLVLARSAPVNPAIGPGKAAIVSLTAADTAGLAASSYHLALILTRPDATPMTVARGTCYVSDP